MHQQNRVCSNRLQADTVGRELRDEELAGVSGSAGNAIHIVGPNTPSNSGPGPTGSGLSQATPPPTFANILLSSLPGLLGSGSSFWNPLIGNDTNSENTPPFGLFGF
jgi:hypothetical protein